MRHAVFYIGENLELWGKRKKKIRNV